MSSEKSRAERSKKNLHNFDLTGADLKEADLSSGVLIEACLKEAKNLTQEQIETAFINRDTIFPDNLSIVWVSEYEFD